MIVLEQVDLVPGSQHVGVLAADLVEAAAEDRALLWAKKRSLRSLLLRANGREG